MKHWVHLGMQKAGSSFLRSLLSQVPDIGLADRQELNFFGYEDDHSYEAYLARFPHKGRILFENSPVYFRRGARCAQPLAETLNGKEAMLSLFLRDPVDAIISHHDMRLRQGFFTRPHEFKGDPRDLTAFVRQNPQYLADWRYMDLLKCWTSHVPVGSLEIWTFEEFIAQPVETLRQIGRRARLDGVWTVDAGKSWKNARPSSAFAHWMLQATGRSRILRAVRHQAMAVPALRKLAERALFSRRTNGDDDRLTGMKLELAEILRPDVLELCDFLGRDRLPWANFFETRRPEIERVPE